MEEEFDEIEGLLNSLDAEDKKEKEGEKKEDTEVAISQAREIDATDTEQVEQALIDQTIEDRKKADKIFELFYADLGFKKDRSQASKEAINKSLELKIMASRNLIELLKLKRESTKNAMGIFINTVSKNKTGIDLSRIQEELDD